MLGINEGTGGTVLLRLGNNRQGQRGFTGGLRPVDFNNTALGQAADTEGDIQTERAGGDSRNGLALVITHAHYRALAKLTFNLAQGSRQRLLFVLVHFASSWLGAGTAATDRSTTVYLVSIIPQKKWPAYPRFHSD